jgi:hypothetical protein
MVSVSSTLLYLQAKAHLDDPKAVGGSPPSLAVSSLPPAADPPKPPSDTSSAEPPVALPPILLTVPPPLAMAAVVASARRMTPASAPAHVATHREGIRSAPAAPVPSTLSAKAAFSENSRMDPVPIPTPQTTPKVQLDRDKARR